MASITKGKKKLWASRKGKQKCMKIRGRRKEENAR